MFFRANWMSKSSPRRSAGPQERRFAERYFMAKTKEMVESSCLPASPKNSVQKLWHACCAISLRAMYTISVWFATGAALNSPILWGARKRIENSPQDISFVFSFSWRRVNNRISGRWISGNWVNPSCWWKCTLSRKQSSPTWKQFSWKSHSFVNRNDLCKCR